jgi:hypothetical protein
MRNELKGAKIAFILSGKLDPTSKHPGSSWKGIVVVIPSCVFPFFRSTEGWSLFLSLHIRTGALASTLFCSIERRRTFVAGTFRSSSFVSSIKAPLDPILFSISIENGKILGTE